MFPNLETERADPTHDRQHGTEKKPNCNGHVLGRFTVFRTVTKRTGAGLLRREQDQEHQTR
jgi:hypothetical protein